MANYIATNMKKLKCDNCKKLVKVKHGWLCEHLNQPMKNGYDMLYSSRKCTGYKKKYDK